MRVVYYYAHCRSNNGGHMSDTMINLPSQWKYMYSLGPIDSRYYDYSLGHQSTPLPSMTAFNYASASLSPCLHAHVW
jgi:hypothetical protein